MSEITVSTWSAIEKAAVTLPAGPAGALRVIALMDLREIIRKSRRSNDQNALLWALYTDALVIGGETLGGWTTEDIHEYMLGEHFGWEVHEALGRKRQKPKHRSSRLTKTEFSDFVEFVVRRFAEHGIVLELPGERV